MTRWNKVIAFGKKPQPHNTAPAGTGGGGGIAEGGEGASVGLDDTTSGKFAIVGTHRDHKSPALTGTGDKPSVGGKGLSPSEPQGSRKREARLKRTPASTELAEQMRKMAQGDHAALSRCYDLIGPMVFSLAVRMMRDRHAAEDVTQDIFVQVWRQASNYDTQRGSAEAWIMMISRTRILDRLRSRAAGVVLKSVGDNLPDAPDAEDWPNDLAVTNENARLVRTALATLPPDQKQALQLAFFDGLTHVEISEKLGVALGTIKTRIRLGLMKIRDRLQPDDTSEADVSEHQENDHD